MTYNQSGVKKGQRPSKGPRRGSSKGPGGFGFSLRRASLPVLSARDSTQSNGPANGDPPAEANGKDFPPVRRHTEPARPKGLGFFRQNSNPQPQPGQLGQIGEEGDERPDSAPARGRSKSGRTKGLFGSRGRQEDGLQRREVSEEEEEEDEEHMDLLDEGLGARREGREPQHDLEESEIVGTGSLVFTIRHLDQAQAPKLYSDPVVVDGHRWRILCFPRGNSSHAHLSVFVDFMDANTMPPDWAKYAFFVIGVWSSNGGPNVYKAAYHRFHKAEPDWGFSQFMPLDELRSPDRGFLGPECTLTLEAKITVARGHGPQWAVGSGYDSKKETGFVGLRNQGATCYMNSILQDLYFTHKLRRAVYAMATEGDDPSSSVPLALQRVFFQLQTSDDAVSTNELTRSFGWTTLDAFMQHDVQGLRDLYASFDDYISVETLDGDNKYAAEGHGLQAARKGVVFLSLPPVLHLQLKRFEYDTEADAMVKVNDRHVFYEHISLDRYLEQPEATPADYTLMAVLVHAGDLHGGHYVAYLRPGMQRPWYKFDDDRVTRSSPKEALQANFGSEEPGKFNAPRVGGLSPQRTVMGRMDRRFTNAYMLVYIRDSMAADVLAEVGPEDIPRHLVERFTREASELERKRKELEESHNHATVRVARQKDFAAWHEYDLCRWDGPDVLALRVRKDMAWSQLQGLIADSTGVGVQQQRLWSVVYRLNKTIRPEAVVTVPPGQDATLLQLAKISGAGAVWRLYLEESPDGLFPPWDSDTLLLFIKYYEPSQQRLSCLGHMFAHRRDTVTSLHPALCARAGLPPDERIDVYEEIKVGMVDPCVGGRTLVECELLNGDILCFQRHVPDRDRDRGASTVPGYFRLLSDRVDVTFKSYHDHTHTLATEPQPDPPRVAPPADTPHEGEHEAEGEGGEQGHEGEQSPDSDSHSAASRSPRGAGGSTAGGQFVLQLSCRLDYATVASRVAERLGADPEYLRFYPHDTQTNGPAQAVRRSGSDGESLGTMLRTTVPSANAAQAARGMLYYELLGVPLAQVEAMRSLSLAWRSGSDSSTLTVLLPATATVADLLAQVRTQVGVSGPLRLLEISGGSIKAEAQPTAPIDSLDTHYGFSLRAEPVPPDQQDGQPVPGEGRRVQVKHFAKTPGLTHSSPFYFVVRRGEPLADTKKRLAAEAGVKPADLAKWRVAVILGGRAHYVEDEREVLYSVMAPDSAAWLGLDHPPPRTPGRTAATEKAVVIHN